MQIYSYFNFSVKSEEITPSPPPPPDLPDRRVYIENL
jgi:hypothetical protein